MITKEKKIFHLARIIATSFKRELEANERVELEDWLQDSEQNRDMYAKFCSQDLIETKIAERLTLEWREDYEKFRIMYKTKRQRRLLRFRLVRYAAILILPLFASILVWKNWKEKDPEVSSVEVNVLRYGKAVLTTATGERIVLDESLKMPLKEYNGVVLNVGEGKVIYNSPEDSVVISDKDAEVYNTLTIPRGGDYYLVLSDGTHIWVNAESEIRYPVTFSGKERVLYLEGEAYFDVAHDKNRPFVVKTERSSVRVLGTQFNLRVYPDEETMETTLVNGSVVLHSDRLEQEIRLQPGEKGTVSMADGSLTREKVYPYFYTAWKDGRLVFSDTRMEDLLDILARWYDLNVFYVNVEAKEIRFTGDLDKSIDFNTILKIIEGNDRVSFDVNGRNISVGVK